MTKVKQGKQESYDDEDDYGFEEDLDEEPKVPANEFHGIDDDEYQEYTIELKQL